jgi:hypothetical protein
MSLIKRAQAQGVLTLRFRMELMLECVNSTSTSKERPIINMAQSINVCGVTVTLDTPSQFMTTAV